MSISTLCLCGERYEFEEQYLGKPFQCPVCKETITVVAEAVDPNVDPIFRRDKFLINQKKLSLAEQYFVNDSNDRPIAFVHRTRSIGRLLLVAFLCTAWCALLILGLVNYLDSFRPPAAGGIQVALVLAVFLVGAAGVVGIIYGLAPIRNVTFHRDQKLGKPILTVRQDFKMAIINARYTLLDEAGAVLARFHKNHFYNLIRRRWYIADATGAPLCVAIEDSMAASIARRVVGPLGGILRTNFVIQTPNFEQTIGEFNRKLTLFDKYVLDMTADPKRKLDRRIALALGVMLDTGESR